MFLSRNCIIKVVLAFFVCGFEGSFGNQFITNKNANIWAVLVAGSSTWSNYRHQADVCHSYQILHKHGIPDERIIVMMANDLAQNSENPTPGIVINHPNGSDVYKGVPLDYTGEAVTPENFMAVLKGDKTALRGINSGKVLKSGPNDHVFISFADHGAPGLIAFPESELSATDFNTTIQYMYEKKKYGKMVIYIEACESGSMFKNLLPKDINVYATTAANAIESSYACYFDDERETYLGDVYSVNWMEDSDKEVLLKESLNKQFKIVKKETNTSHVQEFGDMSIGKLHVSEFQGRKPADPVILPKVALNPVRSRDVPLAIIKRKIMKSNSIEEHAKLLKSLHKMRRNRLFLSSKVVDIVSAIYSDEIEKTKILQERLELSDFHCYNDIRGFFDKECFELSKNEYALDFMYVLVNLCESQVKPTVAKKAMERVCDHPSVHGIA